MKRARPQKFSNGTLVTQSMEWSLCRRRGGERLPWIGGLEEYVGFQPSEMRRVDIPGGEMAQARLWKKRKKQAKLEHRVCVFEREKEKLGRFTSAHLRLHMADLICTFISTPF